MTPSNASPFDTAGSDDHTEDHDGDHDHDGPTDFESDRPGRPPNFFIRRAIVVGGVVAALAGGALVVNALIGNGSDDVATGADIEWNTVALVDERTGDVILTDGEGAEQSRFPSGARAATAATALGATMMITAADSVAVVALSDETVQTFDLAGSDTGIVVPSGTSDVMLATTPARDRLVFAHGSTGDVLDTATFPPIAGAQFDTDSPISAPDGRNLLVTDTGNFQSVLLSFDREAPTFFTGRALAIDDDVVVTTQNVGNEASISVFDYDGSTVTTTRAPSVRAGMISGGKVLLVTVDGEVIELATSSGTTSSLGTVDVGPIESGFVMPTGDRLVVVGAGGSAIIDADGGVVAEFGDAVPLAARVDDPGPRTSTCLALVRASDDTVLIATLVDGSIVEEAEVGGSLQSSADGCAIVAVAPTALTVVSAAGVQRIAVGGELVAVAPDAGVVVVESQSRLVLTDLDDGTRPPESGPAASTPADSVPGDSAPGDSIPGDSVPGDGDAGVDIGPSNRVVSFTEL